MDATPAALRLLDYLNEGVAVLNREGYVVYWNAAAAEITGYSAEEVVGKACPHELSRYERVPSIPNGGECPLQATLEDGLPREAEIRFRHKKGHWLPLRRRYSLVDKAITGQPLGLMTFVELSALDDVQERLARLEQDATVDFVTGLPNRHAIELQLAQQLEELRRYGWRFGVFLADVDHFADLAEMHGRVAGDQILRHIGQTLAISCRTFDRVGRWDDHGFFGVLRNVDQRLLGEIAERICVTVRQTPIRLEGVEEPASATVSVGACLARTADSVPDLCSRVLKMTAESKARGRNAVTLSMPSESCIVRP